MKGRGRKTPSIVLALLLVSLAYQFPPSFYMNIVPKAHAAVTYVGSNTNYGTNSDISVDLSGLSLQQGDLVVAVAATATSGTYPASVATGGYTEIANLYGDDTMDTNLSVNWKIMGVTPDTNVTCTGSNGPGNGSTCIAYVWRGVDQTTPMDVTATTATGSNSATPAPAAITPTTSGAIVIVVGASAENVGIAGMTAPTGYSNHVHVNTSTSRESSSAVASKSWGGGTETPAAWTNWSTYVGGSWAAVTMALRPATGSSAPTVTTSAATSVTATTAILNGNITDTGGTNATVRGFAWGTGSALSGGDTATTTESGSFGTGAFTNSALAFTCNTTYYARAYATNSTGTGLGSIQTFTTSACPVYSVSITSSGVVEYGSVALSTASSTLGNGYTQTTQNDGNSTEKINVKSSDATGGTGWTLASSVGADTFKHEFSTTTGAIWTAMPDSSTYVTADPSVAQSGTVTFDFRLTTPSSSTDYQQKSITITVQAVAP